jgi:hypothetical protein
MLGFVKRSMQRSEEGAAPVLLLFAMSAFSVLGIAAVTNRVGDAPAGTSYDILSGVRDGDLTKFVAPLVVPNTWRSEGGKGSYSFKLPVLVPDNANQSSGSTAAWHAMSDSEVPGMSVCCEGQDGACRGRGDATVTDWNPGSDDARWVSVDLANQPDSSGKTDVVTATLLAASREAASDSTAVSCQLEFRGAIIAKGFAHLRNFARQDGSELPTDVVQGTMDIAVRTK